MASKAIAAGEGDERDGKPASNGNLPVPYDVGYGKPPTQHRFQKGRSGNPGGRPRGANNRPRVIELPAIQAAMRSLAISAMKGSRLSQRALAELVREVEERRTKDHYSALENAFEYKQRWTDELERRARLGIDEPDPIPHPEDVIIDMRTGHVRTEGPLDEREKRSWDERLARRDEAQAEVNSFAERYRRSRSDEHKARWLEEWHFEQRIFDIINDSFPPRYKAKLENRSYREGASREGNTLEAFVQDRKRPKRKRKWGDCVDD